MTTGVCDTHMHVYDARFPVAAEELARQVEAQLRHDAEIGGALVLATAAAGPQGFEVGSCLAERWPRASLLGTSFEGVLAEGRRLALKAS